MPAKTTAITLADLDGLLFCTVSEAAAILCWDRRAVCRGIARGRIPAVDSGGSYRIPVAWLRARASQGTEQAPPPGEAS